jgi:N-acetylglucosamine-6-sulfatase
MGDNGFCFGEHGLIDKRNAYEASMRIPFLAHCPALFEGGQVIDDVVANIDVGPTILHAAGLAAPPQMDGRSFLDVCRGTEDEWRDALLYEYYWERNFPQTPTMFALRTHDYKFIYYFGIWDTDELYDMRNDPLERVNLIRSSDHQQIARDMSARMFAELERTDGMYIPLYPNRGGSQNLRNPAGSAPADFPEWFYDE